MQDETELVRPSRIAGRYEILEKLGSGAFGSVFRAKDTVLGRMVAIKTIRMEWSSVPERGQEMQERFRREAQVAAQLKHPNIITIHDIGEYEGSSYIAMELVEGVGLDKVLLDEVPLPVARVALIGAQVADALGYAHSRNVVHRDVKPANVMLEEEDRVKVADFGIAKPLDAAEQLTATGALLGTPPYMSPEQARGEAVDGRSDLFSVGCLLYEMLTGRRAFGGDSLTAILIKIATEEPLPLTSLNPSVPEPMAAIVARALSKSPAARYPSGKDMARDLAGLAGASGMLPVSGSAETVADVQLGAAATQTSQAGAGRQQPTAVETRVAPPPSGASQPLQTPASLGASAATASGSKKSGSGLKILVGVAAVLMVGFLGIVGLAWLLFSGPDKSDEVKGAVTNGTPAGTLSRGGIEIRTRDVDTQRPGRESPQTSSKRRDRRSVVEEYDDYTEALEDVRARLGRDLGQIRVQTEDGKVGFKLGGTGPAGRDSEDLSPVEDDAMSKLVLLGGAEVLYKQATGRYGTLKELMAAGNVDRSMLSMQGMSIRGDVIEHDTYRYSLKLRGQGYELRATPKRRGLRTLVMDEDASLRIE